MLRKVIEEALLEARRILFEALSKGLVEVQGRGKFGDYSRQFDMLTEKAILNVLRRRLGNVFIISEELGFVPCERPDYYVLVDPVDGSTNASRGIPFFASSIVIAESPDLEDVLAAGVIEHSTGKLYLGDKENGVTINGSPPSLSKTNSLKESLVLVELASLKKESENSINPRSWCTRIITKAKHARFLAAASLEIAYILEGKADAFACVSRDLKIMDFCASISLLKWAGGEYLIIGSDGKISLTDSRRFGVIASSTNTLLQEIYSLRFEEE